MSCNGCRVLRKGCSDQCILRPCLEWIETPQAQGNATLFLSKFFGRSDLISFVAAVPENKRPALFQSLLFEACGRTVNPVNGAVGLLSTGNWHLCQAAVETVLSGGVPKPMSPGFIPPSTAELSEAAPVWTSGGGTDRVSSRYKLVMHGSNGVVMGESRKTASFGSGVSEVSPGENGVNGVGSKEPKLLNLFA